MTPRLPQDQYQERIALPFNHAQVTAGFAQVIFVAALRPFRVKGGKYRNPTGLAAHASNNFAGTLRRCGAADALTIAATTFTTTHASEYVNITAHGLQTGDGPVRLTNSGGALPAGFALATDYYVIVVDANTLQLASTRANAFGGTAVTISGDGTGTHTLTGYTGCRRPVVAATIFDTDADDGAALGADATVTMVLSATDANTLLAVDDELWLVLVEEGTATLPLGAGWFEGLYT